MIIAPLAPEEKPAILAELEALEKQPTNGWDVKYPTLFKALTDAVASAAGQLNMPAPGLVIQCKGLWTPNALAMIFPGNVTQMHLGAHFLKTYFLCTDEHTADQRHAFFEWVLMHELSHLADPAFKFYAQHRQFFQYASAAGVMLIEVGVIGYWVPVIPMWPLLGLGAALVIASKFALKWAHYRFEYTADAGATRALRPCNLTVIESGLKNIVKESEAIAEYIARESNVYGSGLLGRCYIAWKARKFKQSITAFHPPLAKRMQAIMAINNQTPR